MLEFEKQREFFKTGKTRAVNFRKVQLKKLLKAIESHEEELYIAFSKDLHKGKFEAFVTEIGITKKCIKYALKNLEKWVKPCKVPTPIQLFGRISYTVYEPYGTVLILGPFNYPFLTLIEPLAAAIAAGNTAIIKPSEYTPEVSRIITKMVNSVFPKDYVLSVEGEAELAEKLTALPFDLIFFTGSTKIGKAVMMQAAKNLTPVVLELGGKSPAIVCEEANVALAAKKIAWGKLLNAGQICVAPDYCLVHEKVKDKFVESLICEIKKLYGENAENSKDYVRIVNERHAERLKNMIEAHKEDVVYGGRSVGRYVEPTLIDLKSPVGPAMEEEIFGPVLPIVEFKKLEEVYKIVNKFSKPLALYMFSKNHKKAEKILNMLPSGGAMVNDVILHLANHNLPFGGVGGSGMGRYHGKYSMEAFSHKRAVMKKTFFTFDDIIMPPYSGKKLKCIKKIF